ncbi:uncharacterized protein MYCFIDRAFT_58262 [Pseudocercospora fijiensis CIRAD86]|uniref:Uncharacterized protein n=1 Tax=Pseudocercospora fijiensis (strain CIRAD86) TaxID=383855 RepID=M3B093_PSEFD|nr:uncharacterized protein MYCFIDRAFT_58262 [Pseudocercospora fijiensis CIRAD86]EME82828.1 hypothetical protein MYCFIDRAFT_58262 [Pseudocercospora fijiensis CIRAD86]
MARSRRREDLTESWDDVGDSYEEEEETLWDEDEERDEMGSEYRSSARQTRATNGSTKSIEEAPDLPRRRNLRSSVEPELVMPSSPDGGAKAATSRRRDATPRFRLNERSNTSDAGQIRRTTRAATPRSRMIERSMTSDAGRMRKSRLKEYDAADYESEDEPATARYAATIWQQIIRPLLVYATGVTGYALNNLKPILGWILLIYVLTASMVFFSGFLTNSINNALSPICRLPFTGSLPFCPDPELRELQGPAEFDRLVTTQDAFQEVLASASTGVNLPLDMKRSEASIRDLKHVVQYSHLPSKNQLVFEFDGFIGVAREASQSLSKFNSRIGRAVDHILSTNRWTLSVIDGVEQNEAAKGTLSKWVTSNLNIFAPFQPLSMSRDIILDQYLRHTDAVEEQIMSLIDEALVLQGMLNDMDNRLDEIQGVATRDGVRIGVDKDELFSTLWTKLGGNKNTVQKLNSQIDLLNSVQHYRRMAWGHVTSTLLKLQEIQASLEDLRERVGMPEVVGTHKVPLEVHISNIQLGIERLEKQRDANRQIEQDSFRKVLDRGEQVDRRGIGSKQEL